MREPRERHPAVRVEAIHRLQQSEVGDLTEVVVGLAPAGVAARQRGGQWRVPRHQLVPAVIGGGPGGPDAGEQLGVRQRARQCVRGRTGDSNTGGGGQSRGLPTS